MAQVIKRGRATYWVDQDGLEVPKKYLKDVEIKRDKAVTEIFDKIGKLQAEMKQTKEEVEEAIAGFLAERAKEHDEDWQGNATLYDFSKEKMIEVKISKKLAFDESLQIAKSKIDQCIKSWSKGSGQKIKALVNKAFKVDRKGDVDAKTILSLKDMDFEDELWQEAMKIIADSVTVKNTKTYYNFKVKDDAGNMKPIQLNFSRV